MKRYLAILLLPLIANCASTGKQVDSVLKQPPDISRRNTVSDVPYFSQSKGYCGPSTLAMVMNWSGGNTTPENLAPKVMTPNQKGSLQADMISAARREGFFAVPISGLRSLLLEIDSGHPVIVFQNLGLSWYPIWHYAVVFGYDLDKEEVALHTGDEESKTLKLRRLEHSWSMGDYWGLVVLPPGQLAVSPGELEQVRAAAALEQTEKNTEAKTAYDAILKRWPKSLGALIGLGNIAYQSKNYLKAVQILRRAVKLHPNSEIARHNLQIAETALP